MVVSLIVSDSPLIGKDFRKGGLDMELSDRRRKVGIGLFCDCTDVQTKKYRRRGDLFSLGFITNKWTNYFDVISVIFRSTVHRSDHLITN